MSVAEKFAKTSSLKSIGFLRSFDKANRSSISSFRGPGLDEGLKILERLNQSLMLLLLLTFMNHLKQIQFQKFRCNSNSSILCRQTDLVVQPKQRRLFNLKTSISFCPEMKNVIEKCNQVGNHKVTLYERGNLWI